MTQNARVDEAIEIVAALQHWKVLNMKKTMLKVRETVYSNKSENEAINEFGSACSLRGAFPSVLLILLRYSDDPVTGLLKSAMAGGDTCARNAVLGMVYGSLSLDVQWPESWVNDIKVRSELETLLSACE